MIKSKTAIKIRKAHRYLGLFLGIQFLLWTISGLYFSWTNIDEIRGEHLINKNVNLYGFNLSVEPVEKLRSQIQFKNIDQLSNQIKKDIDNALRIFKNNEKN